MRNIVLFTVLTLLAGAAFLLRPKLIGFFSASPDVKSSIEETIIREIKKEVLSPPPLRANEESPEARLTRLGVLLETNKQRVEFGLAALSENTVLNLAAELKLRDMFEKQYFAHENPLSQGPDYFMDVAGYEYIVIGENLALGNFENDAALVQAWMESLGHRENILHRRFKEIGIAVGRGTFEGRITWLAVQEFGTPISACPRPDETTRLNIEQAEQQLDALEAELIRREAEIESMKPRRNPEYNQKVNEYNILVEQYNNLLKELKTTIQQYNSGIEAFNACAQEK